MDLSAVGMKGQPGSALLWLVTKPNDQAVAAPKLDVVPVDKASRLGDRLGIVGANQGLISYEMTVGPDGIRPIFRHPRLSTTGCPENIAPVVVFQLRS
jgi:hypothetical protein